MQHVIETNALANDRSHGPSHSYSGKFKDDLTGQTLREGLVKAARVKELEFFDSKHVWLKVLTKTGLREDGPSTDQRTLVSLTRVTKTTRTTGRGMWFGCSKPPIHQARRISHHRHRSKPYGRSSASP